MAEKEYIEREKLNDMLEDFCVNESFYDALQTIPAADVVPVVRCKDCKYLLRNYPERGMLSCGYYPFARRRTFNDDFCNHGEINDNTKPTTNYDILFTLSQEEMADELLKAEWCDSSCAYGSEMKAEQCKECMLKWLNSKRKEDKK